MLCFDTQIELYIGGQNLDKKNGLFEETKSRKVSNLDFNTGLKILFCMF